jgi:hypothetical protein
MPCFLQFYTSPVALIASCGHGAALTGYASGVLSTWSNTYLLQTITCMLPAALVPSIGCAGGPLDWHEQASWLDTLLFLTGSVYWLR